MKMSTKGLDAIISNFEKLEGSTRAIAHKGLYKAAGVVADEVKAGLQSLPIQEEDGQQPFVHKGQKLTGVTSAQKQDLIDSMGIAPHKDDGNRITTAIGFQGYGSTKTEKHPNGIPNRTLMRRIESGTSIRQKHPVIRPALNRVKAKAMEAAKQEIIKSIKSEV